MQGSMQRWLKRAGAGVVSCLAVITVLAGTQEAANAATSGNAQVQVWRADYRCPAAHGYHLVADVPLREHGTGNTWVYAWLRVYRNKHHICSVNLASERTLGSRRFREVSTAGLSVAVVPSPKTDRGMYYYYAGPVSTYISSHTGYWGVWVGARVASRTVVQHGKRVHLQATATVEVHL